MEITKETRLVGGMGSLYVSGTATGITKFMLTAREDGTKIASITGKDENNATVDVLAQMGLTDAIELYRGESFYCNLNTTITAISVLAGSVKLD